MTGRDAAQAFENFLNGASKQDREEFAEYLTQNTHRTLQQGAMTLIGQCIQKWADCNDKGDFDLRNEATVKLCKAITDKFDKYSFYLPFI
jgi:hypothetical protein